MADGPMSTPRRPAPRSIGTPTMPTLDGRLLNGWLFTCSIVIEAATRLASEIPSGDHLPQQRWRGEARLFELVERDVGDIQSGVQANEVEQREGAHRVTGA